MIAALRLNAFDHGRLGVMDGRRRGPADTATLRPVNSQVRTRPGAPANFRLCAPKTDLAAGFRKSRTRQF
jgi:hypothetical protein